MKKVLLLILGLIVIVPLLLATYLGFVPGLSHVFGFDQPKNLGIVANEQALAEANAKTKVELVSLPASDDPAQSLRYEGSHEVTMTLSSEELTSMVQNSRWKYNPLSQVQVRVNPDGSGEASGYVDFSTALAYLKKFGVSQSDIDAALAKYPIPQSKFPFYVAMTGEVTDNNISASVSKLELARIPVPTGIVNQYLPAATSFVERTYLNGQVVSVKKLENRNGTIFFEGTVPDKEMTVPRE